MTVGQRAGLVVLALIVAELAFAWWVTPAGAAFPFPVEVLGPDRLLSRLPA